MTQPRQTNYARSVSQLKAFDRLSSTIYATNFSWWDSTGKVHELREYFGRPIIVHFWNSTCTQCIATQNLYSRLATEFRDSNLTIVNVLMRESYPADSAVEKLQHVMDSLQISSQQIVGTNELAYTYGGIDVIPTDIFIAPDAHVVGSMIGANNPYESMRNVLLKAMRPGGK